MTRRLWPYLIGEPPEYVRRGAAGQENQNFRAAWASHHADRALLLVTIPWLFLRYEEWNRILLRPENIYEPRFWLAELVFPSAPDTEIFYALLAVSALSVLGALLAPTRSWIRWCVASSLLIVSIPEHGYGHVEHTAHLLLLGHVYSIFRPLGRPERSSAALQARGYSWFLLGLLAVYTASGVWKIVDITIRDVLKPGVNWLDTEAMVATSIASMRGADLPLTIPTIAESVSWVFPIGYVCLTFIFAGSFIAAFRRPFLLVVVPTIAVFHVLNAVLMYVLFTYTILVAIAALLPYDFVSGDIHQRLVPIKATRFEGAGHNAHLEVTYGDGSSDHFTSFYAYRERIQHRSVLLAAPLYYPGVGVLVAKVLEKLSRRAEYQ